MKDRLDLGYGTARRIGAGLALLAPALALGACGGGSSGGGQSGTPSSFVAGTDFDYPAGIAGSPAGFFVEPNEGGDSVKMRLEQIQWGRLADVYDLDSTSGAETLRFHNYVIDETIESDGTDYLYETNPVTQVVSLTVLHQFGTAAFDAALDALDDNLGPVPFKSLDPLELPPFPFVPRNGTLVLHFSDLLDPDTINASTIKVLTGYPPTLPFEARLLADPNHGGLVSGSPKPEFRPTRVLIDLATSPFEAQASGTSIGVNEVGLPASKNTGSPSAALRIPTKKNPATGQFQILSNTSDHGLLASASGPVDLSTPTHDAVRSLRAGGPTEVTGDESNGFLQDKVRPRLIGSQSVILTGAIVDPQGGPTDFLVDVAFQLVGCAMAPEVGDVIELPGAFLIVNAPGVAPVLGIVNDVKLSLLSGSASALPAGFLTAQATYFAPFSDAGDVGREACFVTISPTPTQPPAAKVDPFAAFSVRFSEPMDPTSVTPFDTFTIQRSPFTTVYADSVVGTVEATADFKQFSFLPVLPLHNASVPSAVDDYRIDLVGGVKGLRDLAGNPIDGDPAKISIGVDTVVTVPTNGSFVLRFNSLDEKGSDTLPEVRGQFVHDPTLGVIKPRPVKRFSGTVERKEATVISGMAAVPAGGSVGGTIPIPWLNGVKDPLVPLGNRTMALWRYVDMHELSLVVNDESLYNLDVERLSWSPFSGGVVADFFEEFEISLAHSLVFPDEYIDPLCIPVQLAVPNSGMTTINFDGNALPDPAGPKKVVHPAAKGYLLSPAETELTGAGTVVMPYPLNSGADVSQFTYFTWRDTAVTGVGGTASLGIDPGTLVYGALSNPTPLVMLPPPALCGPALAPLHGLIAKGGAAGEIPSIGLPLLMEFKCFDKTALGLNSFDTSIAANPLVLGNWDVRPIFRIFSSGGYQGIGGVPIEKDPESQPAPTGGFSDNPTYPPSAGAPSPAADNIVYMGRADFVIRVSRAHTLWFDALNANPDHAEPVILPDASEQPAGTSVTLAFRGADGASSVASGSANCMDAYGDTPAGVLFSCTASTITYGSPAQKNLGLLGITNWRNSIQLIDGSQFFQARITFLNNTASGQSPELSALGFSFVKP